MIQSHNNLNEIEYLVAPLANKREGCPVEFVLDAPLLSPFSNVTIAFLNQLSTRLLKGVNTELSPELVSLGYWIRPAQLKKFERQFRCDDDIVNKPLGCVLHIAPSNVDIQFFYSWVLSLLMGNTNIVRASQVESEMKTQLVTILAELLSQPEHRTVAQNNLFVSWPHNDAVTEFISRRVSARMLWGSDDSIAHIRQLPCRVDCRDIVFSDKYSISIVDIDELQDECRFAEALSRDISAFSQRACSSPKVVFCCSENAETPQRLLEEINKLGSKNNFSPGRTVNHLVTEQLLGAKGVLQGVISLPNTQVLQLRDFSPSMLSWHAGESQLFWVNLTTPEQVIEYIDEKCQTISYFGVEKERLLSLVKQMPINAIDRVVPLGSALEFDVIWDGYDLFSQLSKTITVS